MTEKTKMQEIIKTWKLQNSPAEKKAFLEKVKQDVDNKSDDELFSGIKALGELAQDLQTESWNLLHYFKRKN